MGSLLDVFEVTPQQAIAEAEAGQLRPLYVVVGEEQVLVDEVVTALRQAATGGAPSAFNEDKFVASDVDADTVIGAARTAPMMSARRFVYVRNVERWEARSSSELDRLADYAGDPVDSTVMMLVATKINGSRRLMRTAKKADYLVRCDTPKRHLLPAWVLEQAAERGHRMTRPVAESLAELVGPELVPIVDALDRLSLFVGEGQEITEEALGTVVTRVPQEAVWALVDALGDRHLDKALAALTDAYDSREGGLPLVGAVAWRVRQLIKFRAALKRGLAPGEAAKVAGVPPFKANSLRRTVRELSGTTLQAWLSLLAEADLALKGSKRPWDAVLATMVVAMCSRN